MSCPVTPGIHGSVSDSLRMKNVLSRNANFVNSPEFSDVKFIFKNMSGMGSTKNHGEDKGVEAIIYGHKLILAMASPVFRKVFYMDKNNQQFLTTGKDEIRMDDCGFSAEAFLKFIRFLYTDEIFYKDLEFEVIVGILTCADYYNVPCLKKDCAKEIKEMIRKENVFRTMEIAKMFGERDLAEVALKFIDQNLGSLVESEKILCIKLETLFEILKRDLLDIDECFILDLALKWAGKECERKDREPTGQNKREVLGKVFFEIKFGLLTSDRISALVSSNLLTRDEALGIVLDVHRPGPGYVINADNSKSKRSGDVNQSQPISVQGTNNPVSTVATNNSRDPGQVIALIEALKADGGQKRTVGAVNQFTTFLCRSIRVGLSRGIKGSHNLVTMSDFGILFDFPHSRTEATVRCAVPVEQVLTIYVHYSSRLPLLVVTTTPRYAVWLRERLGMTDPSMPNYFCPLNGGNSQKHLIFMLEKFTALEIGVINRTFKRALIEIDYDKANTLLMRSTSPTPVPRQLLTMKLGNNPLATTLLTTDLLCLAEEQFLNDQMIDFWLEYTLSKLSETNRARTHAFSTFFYKCLTTRRISCAPWENDNKLSAAEKRHCRVKKWTKNVDIFSKDFIIIPINENAHWFLAFICFPGVNGICSMDDGSPLPDIKNERDKKLKKAKLEEMEEDPYVDPDRDEEVDYPEEEMQSETDDEGTVEMETDETEDARREGNVPNSKKGEPRVKQPCILAFDSMPNESRDRVYSTLREYIRIEYNVKKGVDRPFNRIEMPGYKVKVLDQSNHYDSGLYLLQYVESFFSKPLRSFLLPIINLRRWFPDSIVHKKRKKMYEEIYDLIKTEQPENVRYIPELKFSSLPPEPIHHPTSLESTSSTSNRGRKVMKRQSIDDVPGSNAKLASYN